MKPIIIFIILFPLTLCLLGYIGYLNDPHRQSTESVEDEYASFQAWVRIYRYPLTFEQWRDLKEKNLLPTQAAPFLPPNPSR